MHNCCKMKRCLHLTVIFFGMIIYAIPVFAQSVPVPDTAGANRLLRKGIELTDSNPDSAIFYFNKIISGFRYAESSINYQNATETQRAYLETVIRAFNLTGNIFYFDDEFNRAEIYFRHSLQIAQKAGLAVYIAKAFYDIGYIRYATKNYMEAKKLFLKSYDLYRQSGSQTGMCKTLNGCGLSEYHLGRYNTADSCLQEALHIASEINDSARLSDIKVHLGILYCEQGRLDNGIVLFEQALDYYERKGDSDAISDAALNIGVVMKMIGEYDKALDYIKRSTEIEELSQQKSRLAVRYYNLADLYLEMGDNEKAYEYCLKTLTIANEIASKPYVAETNFLMGKYFMLEKKYTDAINYFTNALKTAEKSNDQTLISNIYLWYARAFFRLHQYAKTEETARKAYEISKNLNMISIERDAALLLSENYQKTGNPGQALTWYKVFHNLSDSINFFRQQKAIKQIEARYNYEKKERENELLRNQAALREVQLKNRTITMIVLALAILLSVVVIVLLISRMKYARALAREQQMINLQKLDKLTSELEGKKRELATKMMFLNQKNELIEKIISQLKELQQSPDIDFNEVNALVNELRSDSPQGNWKEFEAQFVQVYPGFYKRLYQRYPDLSSHEQRIAAFLRMNLNTKEIAAITGRSTKSIEVTRSRLRKKLGLNREENLNSFLASI